MGEKCSVLLQLGQCAALVVPVEGGGGKEPEVVLVGVAIEGVAVPRELDLGCGCSATLIVGCTRTPHF